MVLEEDYNQIIATYTMKVYEDDTMKMFGELFWICRKRKCRYHWDGEKKY